MSDMSDSDDLEPSCDDESDEEGDNDPLAEDLVCSSQRPSAHSYVLQSAEPVQVARTIALARPIANMLARVGNSSAKAFPSTRRMQSSQ